MMSLMSLRMFYKLPSTIAEFKASGYKFLVYEDHKQNFPLDDFRFMMLGEDELEDAYDNSTDTTGTSICIFTTSNSSLDKISPLLLPTLLQQYPTTFVTMKSYVDMEIRKLATLVLLDLTAYHYEQRLNQHPCYKKSAKFVILMGGTSFDRKETALKYLHKYAILNFVLIPLTDSSESVSVYTWNQYTGQEHYFRSTDRPVHRFFPDKLRNLNGYRFTMYGVTNYPYLLYGPEGKAYGLVPNFVNIVIRKRCNGTTYHSDNTKLRNVMDANFNLQDERFSFQNTFYFWEETGIYLVCPVRSVRDFLRHLLKPFSLGIWLILGGLFALCQVAEILFPNIYRYDLIGVTFFGGGGVEYRQPFAFRIVTLTLAVLMFFLSEAYNTKIISLMSFAKFTEQPQTLDAIQQSDLRIMSSRGGVDFFGQVKNNFLSYPATLRAQKRYGQRVYEHYCAMMYKGNAWVAVASELLDLKESLYMIPEPLMIDKMLIQLIQHSPFFDLFERMFGLVNECEVCIVTTAVSTLGHTHPNVVPLLSSKNPVTFATHNHIKPMLLRKYANLVLLDATGWEQYGIVNYAIVPMPSNNTEPVHNISLYTENQFSRAKIYVRMNDLDHLQRLYPNKLLNLHRYHIRIAVFSDFPYIILPRHGAYQAGGLISHFFNDVGRKKLNLSYAFQIIDDEEVEASFNAASFREHFQHEIDLREMGGLCMLCPVDTGRDFLTHLLKPFSYSIWMVLGAVYVVCQFLQHRYPATFCYDLTLLTFFGGGGVEYRQAFPFRIALLILAMLLFFLSEAYNTKIISLMSLSKFYERPETMAEFRATDYRIVLETPRPLLLGDLYPKVLNPRETARLRRKLGIRLYRH
uniref:Uncharacterized protein n=1 Tax=Anopheles merus TaxID=30066 RepID=A0A182V572_ANOME